MGNATRTCVKCATAPDVALDDPNAACPTCGAIDEGTERVAALSVDRTVALHATNDATTRIFLGVVVVIVLAASLLLWRRMIAG